MSSLYSPAYSQSLEDGEHIITTANSVVPPSGRRGRLSFQLEQRSNDGDIMSNPHPAHLAFDAHHLALDLFAPSMFVPSSASSASGSSASTLDPDFSPLYPPAPVQSYPYASLGPPEAGGVYSSGSPGSDVPVVKGGGTSWFSGLHESFLQHAASQPSSPSSDAYTPYNALHQPQTHDIYAPPPHYPYLPAGYSPAGPSSYGHEGSHLPPPPSPTALVERRGSLAVSASPRMYVPATQRRPTTGGEAPLALALGAHRTALVRRHSALNHTLSPRRSLQSLHQRASSAGNSPYASPADALPARSTRGRSSRPSSSHHSFSLESIPEPSTLSLSDGQIQMQGMMSPLYLSEGGEEPKRYPASAPAWQSTFAQDQIVDPHAAPSPTSHSHTPIYQQPAYAIQSTIKQDPEEAEQEERQVFYGSEDVVPEQRELGDRAGWGHTMQEQELQFDLVQQQEREQFQLHLRRSHLPVPPVPQLSQQQQHNSSYFRLYSMVEPVTRARSTPMFNPLPALQYPPAQYSQLGMSIGQSPYESTTLPDLHQGQGEMVHDRRRRGSSVDSTLVQGLAPLYPDYQVSAPPYAPPTLEQLSAPPVAVDEAILLEALALVKPKSKSSKPKPDTPASTESKINAKTGKPTRGKARNPRPVGAAGAMFVNFTALDSKKILSGVAPSGSTKKKVPEPIFYTAGGL